MTTLAEAQAKVLLLAAAGDRLEVLYAVALATGMRLGELLALKWRDVDLEGRSLQVRATLQNIAGRFEFSEPKTSRSRRRIVLSRLAPSPYASTRCDRRRNGSAREARGKTSTWRSRTRSGGRYRIGGTCCTAGSVPW